MSPENPQLRTLIDGHIDRAHAVWKRFPADLQPDVDAFRDSIVIDTVHAGHVTPLHPDLRPDLRPAMMGQVIMQGEEQKRSGLISYFYPESGITVIDPVPAAASDSTLRLAIYHQAGVFMDQQREVILPDAYTPVQAHTVSNALAVVFPPDAGITIDRTRLVRWGKIFSLQAAYGDDMRRVSEILFPGEVMRTYGRPSNDILARMNQPFPTAFELMTALGRIYPDDRKLTDALARGSIAAPTEFSADNPVFAKKFLGLMPALGGKWRPVLRALHAPDLDTGTEMINRTFGVKNGHLMILGLTETVLLDERYRNLKTQSVASLLGGSAGRNN